MQHAIANDDNKYRNGEAAIFWYNRDCKLSFILAQHKKAATFLTYQKLFSSETRQSMKHGIATEKLSNHVHLHLAI